MKYLITGLGNIGEEYHGTRHNIGFRVVNELARAAEAVFTEERYGAVARFRVKNAEIVALKPNTYMNESGLAVRYWLQKENLPVERLLIVVDDLALPFASLRLKAKGSHGGHNGLRNIEELIATQQYARLRFGIGNNFLPGKQYDYVLSRFTEEEEEALPAKVETAAEIVRSFCLAGIDVTMNLFN
jgi:PTH1 family peptidyl-tRNA hydrolase